MHLRHTRRALGRGNYRGYRGEVFKSLIVSVGIVGSLAAAPSAQAAGLDDVDHIVILTQENNSFDKLFGGWEKVNGPGVGKQTDQNGAPLDCLLQTLPSFTTPPLLSRCSGRDAGGKTFRSHFGPGTFDLTQYASMKSSAGNSLRHSFYQERYQINGGQMDRFVVGNDQSAGLAMGMWDTRRLPLYRYLHKAEAPRYVIADRFFHAAFGGSFLNHQWLVAGRTPRWPKPPSHLRAVVDRNGMPGTYPAYPLYRSPQPNGLRDGQVTARCTGYDVPCGNYIVNTSQPKYQPHLPGARYRVPPLKGPTIGSRMTKAGVRWAWYSQGWSNAAGLRGKPGWTNGKKRCTDPGTRPGATFPFCPNVAFQFHHQPFNYFAAFSPNTARGRDNRAAHLRDYVQFRRQTAAKKCRLPDVSFVKLMSGDNEHPGAGGPWAGSKASVRLIKSVVGGACGSNTMVIITYDENGGAWDHVRPPSTDQWGPGTRVPTLIVAPGLRKKFAVDSVEYDTTSIAATLSERYDLRRLGSRRTSSLASVWDAR